MYVLCTYVRRIMTSTNSTWYNFHIEKHVEYVKYLMHEVFTANIRVLVGEFHSEEAIKSSVLEIKNPNTFWLHV